jgi:hypothetical protein
MHLIQFYVILLFFAEEQELAISSVCRTYNQSFTPLHVGTYDHAPQAYQLHASSSSASLPIAIKLNAKEQFWTVPVLLFDTLQKPPSKACCTLHHYRKLKHVALVSLWHHKFAARHVAIAVQSGPPKTWHSRQISWKPIESFRTLKTATHSTATSEPYCCPYGRTVCPALLVHQKKVSAIRNNLGYLFLHEGVRSVSECPGMTAETPRRYSFSSWRITASRAVRSTIRGSTTSRRSKLQWIPEALGNTSPRRQGESADSCVF